MIRRRKGNIEWLEFELLEDEPGIAHGVFLRHGGVSQGSFASLNAIQRVGDDEDNVKKKQKLYFGDVKIREIDFSSSGAWHQY